MVFLPCFFIIVIIFFGFYKGVGVLRTKNRGKTLGKEKEVRQYRMEFGLGFSSFTKSMPPKKLFPTLVFPH